MEEAYQDAIEKIKNVILFLNKLKLDKKTRLEKEDIVKGLDSTVTKSLNYLDQDTYDEVESNAKQKSNESDLLYDDSASPEQIAAQNDDVYIDTAEPQAKVPSSDYDDCQTLQVQGNDVIHDVPCEELRDAIICDFLNVKRERNILKGTWQKRWCVISQNVFYMYDSSKDKKQKEAFNLKGFHFEIRDDIAKDRAKKDRCFEIKNNATQKSYEFYANDKESVAKWETAFNDSNKNYKNSPSEPRRSSSHPESPAHVESGKSKGKLINISMFGFSNKKKNKDTQMTIEPSDELYIENVVSPIPTEDEENENMYDDNVIEQTYDDTQTPGVDVESEETYEELESEAKPKKSRTDAALPPIPRTSSQSSGGGRPPPLPNAPKPLPQSPKTPSRPGKSDDLPPLPPPKDMSFPPTPNDSRALPSFPSDDLPLPPPKDHDAELLDEKNLENWFQGIWDCEADDDGELSFKKGDIMHVISKEFDSHGWWAAKINRVVGLVPSSYLMEAYII